MRDDLHGDVKPREFAPSQAPVKAFVRRMTPDDIEWALSIGRNYYEGRYDEQGVRLWLHARLSHPTMILLRSEHAVGIAHLGEHYHAPGHVQAFLTLLYAEPGNYGREILRLVEAIRDWAVEKKCSKFWASDITGYDLGALLKIIGGRTAGHTYVVDLDGDPNALG
jgi:hypothetical protein